jgi:hypothetical protein
LFVPPSLKKSNENPLTPTTEGDGYDRPNRAGSGVESCDLTRAVDDLSYIADLLKHLGHATLLLYTRFDTSIYAF